MSHPTTPLDPDSDAGRELARDLTDILARNELAIEARKARAADELAARETPKRRAA